MRFASGVDHSRHSLRDALVQAGYGPGAESPRHLLARCRDRGRLTRMAHSYGGYTTNLAAGGSARRQSLGRLRVRRRDLAPEHGGPARLLVPHLYLWKSAKWVRGIEPDAAGLPRLLRSNSATTTTATHGASSGIRGPKVRRAWRAAPFSSSAAYGDGERQHALVLEVPDGPGIWLGSTSTYAYTAPDGYQAARSYSLGRDLRTANASRSPCKRVPDGEVSSYLVDEAASGDSVEVRGPVGGWFVWQPEDDEPVLLVAGGSGVVPLMAMIRTRDGVNRRTVPAHLLACVLPKIRSTIANCGGAALARTAGSASRCPYTRTAPEGDATAGRADQRQTTCLTRLGLPGVEPSCYVCGPTGSSRPSSDLLGRPGARPGQDQDRAVRA